MYLVYTSWSCAAYKTNIVTGVASYTKKYVTPGIVGCAKGHFC